jgi:hypothetical protein
MFKIDRKDADARVVAAQAVKPPPEPPKIEVAPDPIERRLLYTLRDSMSFVAVHESVHGTNGLGAMRASLSAFGTKRTFVFYRANH